MERRARVTSRSDAPSPLGALRLAGRIDHGQGIRPRRARNYPSYALVLVTRGSGRYRDARWDVPLVAGDAVLVFPGQPHWYGVTGPGTWDEVFLVFDGPLYTLAEEAGLIQRSRPVVRAARDRSWARRIDSFRTRPSPAGDLQRDAEAVEILHLLTDLVQAADRGSPSEAADWRQVSRRLLSEELAQQLDLHDVAAACGMSYESWRRKFREDTGEPPARYRLHARLDAAEAMLRLTSASVREIALNVGLTDEQHLNRHFLATRGVTARQYRDRRPG